VKTLNDNATALGFSQVQRDWRNPVIEPDTQPLAAEEKLAKAETEEPSSTVPFALWRWQNETMRDQPYNNIGAVPYLVDQKAPSSSIPGRKQ
jgi:hypothetical protein